MVSQLIINDKINGKIDKVDSQKEIDSNNNNKN